jgi:hypothetical protein
MLDTAIQVNRFLMGYLRRLIEDLADERLAEQPHAGVNHPAWILGHLALTADSVQALLGAQKTAPADWASLFGSGSKPNTSRSAYPSKDELVHAVEHNFEQLRQRVVLATAEQLSQPNPHARTKAGLPTVKDVLAFLLTGHLGVHLGQLSAWRRLIGLPPMF